jgi:hypothetical protein
MENSAILDVAIENLDIGIGSMVAQLAVLKDIYLVDAKISRDPLTMFPEVLSLEHKCSTEMFSNEKNITLILCNFQVAAFNGKSPDKLVMKIEASFCTSYAWKLTDALISDENDSPDILAKRYPKLLYAAEYLFTINPIFDAWPYWREFAQSTSSRMGFPALTVPLLEIRPKKSAAKKEKSQPIKKKSTRRKKVNA